MFIKPSSYSWILPIHVDLTQVDQMALDGSFPTIEGLIPAFGYAMLFGLVRLVFQTILFRPLAIYCMKLKFSTDSKITEIDKIVDKNGKSKVSMEQIKALSSSTGMSEDSLRKYMFNKRLDNAKERKVVKFSEAIWRAIFYAGFCVLGYYALFAPEMVIWLQDTKHHWIDWPHHSMSEAIRLYYLLELGCYFHQLMWTEVTRSDAAEMILHHLITILLIVASYLTNYTRIGASILLVHDVSDVFLEVGKLFNYVSKVKERRWFAAPVTDTLFGFFAISFFATRLVMYPRYLLYSLVIEAPAVWGGIWPGYWYFAALLSALQCLHVFWFYLISRMIYKIVKTGGVEKDERSDDDDEEEEEEGSPAGGSVGSSPKGGNKRKTK